MVFVVMADRVPDGATLQARDELDRFAAVLTAGLPRARRKLPAAREVDRPDRREPSQPKGRSHHAHASLDPCVADRYLGCRHLDPRTGAPRHHPDHRGVPRRPWWRERLQLSSLTLLRPVGRAVLVQDRPGHRRLCPRRRALPRRTVKR